MDDIAIRKESIPATIEDLSQFVLVGRDRLTAVRAAIRAIDKVGVAADVYRQKLAEGQEIAEAVLDAEVRLGELRKAVERNEYHGGRMGAPQGEAIHTPLREFDGKAQITRRVAPQLESIASHPAIVERVKADARENGELVTRQAVLKAIRADRKAAGLEQAREKTVAQTRADANAPVLFVRDSIGLKLRDPVDLLLTDPPYMTDVDDINALAVERLPPALWNVRPTGFAYVCIGAYPEELRAYLNTPVPSHMKL